MKSQMLTLLVLTIGAIFFQPTHQYRLSKRELTEYDLISFIVGTCSTDQSDMLIQNLCDQTLQSALTGNFPFLTYYCKTIGAGMSYCNNINRHTVINQNVGAKRFIYRRFARSLDEDKNSHEKGQDMGMGTDLEQKLIMQICIPNGEKTSVDTNQFCTRTIQGVQQGRYPEIKRLCMYHVGSDYCQHVQSSSSSWPLSKSSSLLSSDSIIPNNNPSFVPLSGSKMSDVESAIDQQRVNNSK